MRNALALTLPLLLTAAICNAQNSGTERSISVEDYVSRLHGFWLCQSIANWTGLVTEMDRVQPPFYTDEDWGALDQPSIWGSFVRLTQSA